MLNTGSPIKGFFGEYRWLSNFAPCVIVYDGFVYPSVENAYVAAKTVDMNARIETQGRYLEETNTWNDRFWGVCGTGQNMLGSLIMDIRDSLTEENSGV